MTLQIDKLQSGYLQTEIRCLNDFINESGQINLNLAYSQGNHIKQ